MLRATHLSREYPPNVYGGSGVHVDHLTRALRTFARVEVLYFDEKPHGSEEEVNEVGVHSIPPFECGRNRTQEGEERVIDAIGRSAVIARSVDASDIVHAHDWSTCLAGVWLSKLHGAPLVLTAHSLEVLRPWKEAQVGARAYELSCWMERVAYQEANRVICVSHAMKSEIQRLYALSEERFAVIPNGVDTALFSPDAARVQRRVDLPVDYVMFAGRASQQKGIDIFLRAINFLSDDRPVVLCLGKAETQAYRRKIQREIEAIKARSNRRIEVVDELPHEDMASFYAQAAVTCVPSRFEPFGLVNIESMACATPVVATAVDGIPELIRQNQTGILVSPCGDDDTLARRLAREIDALCGCKERRNTMGERARADVVARFDWYAIAHQVFSEYQKLTGGTLKK
jgi:starch synthase